MRYCEMCDEFTRHRECRDCGADTLAATLPADRRCIDRAPTPSRLQRLQAAADAGRDTWSEYRSER